MGSRSAAARYRRRAASHRWRRLLPALWDRQGGLCCWCRGLTFLPRDVKNMSYGWPSAAVRTVGPNRHPAGVVLFGHVFPSASVEHIVPRRDGGSATDPDNLAMACTPCNRLRESLSLPEFLAYVGVDPGVLVDTPASAALTEDTGHDYETAG